MFSKTKDNGIAPETTPQTPQTQQQVRRSSPARASAPSIISSDMTVIGTVTATGDIQVDGKIEGDIYSTSLTVGEKAVINGEVRADEIIIRGHVIGGIRARKISLASTCHVEGDLCHNALQVETGAFFQGNIKHSDDPLSDNPPADPRTIPGAAQRRPLSQVNSGARANDEGEPSERQGASSGGSSSGSQQGQSNQASRPGSSNNNPPRKAQGGRN